MCAHCGEVWLHALLDWRPAPGRGRVRLGARGNAVWEDGERRASVQRKTVGGVHLGLLCSVLSPPSLPPSSPSPSPSPSPCKGGYPCPPSEFQSLVCRYFERFPCRSRNFDKTSIACRHFVALVSLFQGRVASRNLPLSGPYHDHDHHHRHRQRRRRGRHYHHHHHHHHLHIIIFIFISSSSLSPSSSSSSSSLSSSSPYLHIIIFIFISSSSSSSPSSSSSSSSSPYNHHGTSHYHHLLPPPSLSPRHHHHRHRHRHRNHHHQHHQKDDGGGGGDSILTQHGLQIPSHCFVLLMHFCFLQDIILELLRDAIVSKPHTKGFLVDGFPRELNQAQDFEKEVPKQSGCRRRNSEHSTSGRARFEVTPNTTRGLRRSMSVMPNTAPKHRERDCKKPFLDVIKHGYRRPPNTTR